MAATATTTVLPTDPTASPPSPQPWPSEPPHLLPRATSTQDPSTSTWRITLPPTAHLQPSPLHPSGLLPSAGSPWPDDVDVWALSDKEREQRVVREVRVYEVLIERRPVSPWEGEESREERRRRLLRSESEVEAWQAKEAVPEDGYGGGTEWRRESEEEMREGHGGGTEGRDEIGDVGRNGGREGDGSEASGGRGGDGAPRALRLD